MATLQSGNLSTLRPRDSEVRRVRITDPFGCVVSGVNVGTGCVVQIPLEESLLLCAYGKAKVVPMDTPTTEEAQLAPKPLASSVTHRAERAARRARMMGEAPVAVAAAPASRFGYLEGLLEKNAPDVVAALEGKSAAELAILGAMESAGKGRKGLLEAIDNAIDALDAATGD